MPDLESVITGLNGAQRKAAPRAPRTGRDPGRRGDRRRARYVVFHDRTRAEIAERKRKEWGDLAAVSGVGPAKLERYADEVLAIVEAG